jgi:hypothetical protein
MILHRSQRRVTDADTFMNEPYLPRSMLYRDSDHLDPERGGFFRHLGKR